MRRPLPSVALTALIALLAAPAVAEPIRWEQIDEEDGIRVWQRKIPGRSLVEFRGRGVIPAHFKKILAVLADHKRKTEWMASCVDNGKVEDKGPGRVVMYNRTGSSFPLVSDRDVVLESAVDIWSDKRRIKVDVWSVEHPDVPEKDGVVRMPELRASWTLVALDEGRTEVTYQVRADPGGAIPHWVVNIAAKSLPLNTLRNLRAQVKKDGYDAELARVNASFDWSGFAFDAAPPPATLGAAPMGPSMRAGDADQAAAERVNPSDG